MSSSSDSEEFYDAEDITSSQSSRNKPRKTSAESLTKRSSSVPNFLSERDNTGDTNLNKFENTKSFEERNDNAFIEPKPKLQPAGSRKKFKELREKLQNEDEEGCGNVTPPQSQTSSVEGVFAAASKTSHPFRVIEQDTISLQSFNSVGRIRALTNTTDSRKTMSVSALSSSSLDSESTQSSKKYPSTYALSSAGTAKHTDSDKSSPAPLQEPDVIASTKVSSALQQKHNVAQSGVGNVPVAPPRRKKKSRINDTLALTKSASTATFSVPKGMVSPVSTIESLTREIERLPSISSVKSYKSERMIQHHSDDSRSSTLRSGHSLDINQEYHSSCEELGKETAIKGQFVVKPMDTESIKAQGTGYICSMKPLVEHTNSGPDRLTAPTEESSSSSSRTSNRSSLGHYSLGPHRGTHQSSSRHTSKDRRRSAGDENLLCGGHMKVRTHTDSGKQLSDLEILEQVTVLNLDTGERIPLSVAEDKLPQCINPLSLHIMRLTSEYVSSSSMEKEKESDEESVDIKKTDIPIVDDTEAGGMRKRTAKLRRLIGTNVKKAMDKAKSIAQEVSHARHKEDIIDIVDSVHPGEQNCKLKASNSHKGPFEFEKIEHIQELKDDQHEGSIWCMKFSSCGRLLATAGQDKILRIWVVRDAYPFFQDMRTKYNAEKVSPTPSQESLASHHSTDHSNLAALEALTPEQASRLVFMPKPFCTYSGHTSDLLDVSWSKNYFILSSSMDKTVRLWHISRKECLCCFQHIDFVTAIVFHPRDDRYFLSGSLDGKLRLWNIPDKKVAVWNEVEGNPRLITAANFCQNGKFAVVGTYDGRCIFYSTDQLKYHTQIHVRSSRGRNAIGRKVSGIEPMPGEDKILVTSNDSRIRLYDLRDLNVSCKYKGKGYVNMSSQIKASFSHDGKYIVSGSENRDIYIWKTNHDYAKFSSVRRDRNDFWEAIKAHNAVVTCAIFAPNPEAIIKMIEENQIKSDDSSEEINKVQDPVVEQHTKGCGGYVLVSADFNGCIKVFVNKTKPKHSSLPVSAMA
ncbi:WD repeat-containing protein 44 isoform X2 [Anthonomus grandis grandis]|uniref:WD repeat-containing protein 44 isoform X2 n=1 Tax=Anthonomus grandis grandis TaxID=2921223 RepID=UPI0021655A92|nr:WD repeat-containing protein 44 isoform X2 [Anthonomus grandis grandis]